MHRARSIKKYFMLTSVTLQTAMAYRVSFLLSFLAGLVQALVLYYIWRVVFNDEQVLNGFNLSQMVTYIFISYAVKNLYGFHTETNISVGIRDGSVATELIKPLNYQVARFFESLGSVIVEGILIGSLVLLLGVTWFHIESPSTVTASLGFAISLILSLFINFSISYIVGLCSFWTTSVFGIVNSKRFIMDFLSGGLVPLAFFPRWLKNITFALPFHSVVHAPVSIYLGKITGKEICDVMITQIVWAVILWIVGSLLWSRAIRKITIYGG
ncbi:MAG: hypothetical protein F4Y79_07805 [Gemmatimonadetes bacterium]|nr:hypothetical protein [Gemmatimonadota bacterium]